MDGYQFREIGEGGWSDCDQSWYAYCEQSPLHDTRRFEKPPCKTKQVHHVFKNNADRHNSPSV